MLFEACNSVSLKKHSAKYKKFHQREGTVIIKTVLLKKHSANYRKHHQPDVTIIL